MTLLIAGFGELGQGLAALRHAAGERVLGIRRTPFASSTAQVMLADLLQPESYAGRLHGVERLVYCVTPGQREQEAYRQIYVNAFGRLLAIARTEGWPLRRIIFVSSTAVYADDGADYTESSPAVPADFNGKVMLEAERVALSSGVHASVLRLGGIYGPGRTWMLRRAESDAAVASERWSNRIHVEDAVQAISFVLQCDQPSAIYNVVDPHPAREFEVLNWLRLRSLRPPLSRVSGSSGKRVWPDALRAQGFHWRYPDFRAGYASVLAALPPAEAV